MATRKQIAELAGVSQATVSRLLNGDAKLRITAQTRRRIMRAAAQLGYTAFTSRMIAVLNAPPEIDELQDAYFQSLREELRTAAEEQGSTLVFFASIDELIDAADDYDGFIAIGPATFTREQLGQLRRALPYGTFIDTNPAPDWFDSVRPDLSQTMLDALDALQGAGHTRIGFIGGIGAIMGLHNQPEDIRTLAFTDWSRRLHLDNDALIYASGPFTVDNGRALAERILAQHSPDALPDALVVASDPMAVGVLQGFLDSYLADHPGEVDYIHDDDALIALAKQPNAIGFLLPAMEKSQLFRGVIADGILPRKTFSMGHSREKRYYLEGRKIK